MTSARLGMRSASGVFGLPVSQGSNSTTLSDFVTSSKALCPSHVSRKPRFHTFMCRLPGGPAP